MNDHPSLAVHLSRFLAITTLLSSVHAQTRPSSPDAAAIVESVTRDRRTGGLEVRARLVSESASGSKTETKQIMIKRRHSGDRTLTLYQASWPASWKGKAVVIETENGALKGGYFFEPPDKVIKIGPESVGKTLLGSNLTVEDVSESFWDWPNPRIVERAVFGRTECVILEFRAPKGIPGETQTVRAWIDEKANIPVIIDKFDRLGKRTKRIEAENLKRNNEGEWIPSKLRIESFVNGSQTHVIPSRGKRNIEVEEEEFSVEALRRILSTHRDDEL